MRKIDGDIVIRKGETWHINGSILVRGKLIYEMSGDAWAYLIGDVPDATRVDDEDIEIDGELLIEDGACLKCSERVGTMVAFEHVFELPESASSAQSIMTL